ncbi:MAG: hypothetical protein QG552_1735 [Thermodesulfobacteriota bacterium]|nr:hypothetical protein [Thermodesulfobacteriota bacterium]
MREKSSNVGILDVEKKIDFMLQMHIIKRYVNDPSKFHRTVRAPGKFWNVGV